MARPRTLTPADLAGLPRAAHDEPFTCEEGWAVPGLRWGGVRLAAVLALAEPLPGARFVRVGSGDYVIPVRPRRGKRGSALRHAERGAAVPGARCALAAAAHGRRVLHQREVGHAARGHRGARRGEWRAHRPRASGQGRRGIIPAPVRAASGLPGGRRSALKITASAIALVVDDVAASAAFLKDHFGFQEEMAADGFVSLARADAGFNLIFLRTGLASLKPEGLRGRRADGLLVVFVVDDVDAEYERLQREGVPITTPIETEPWGERFFQVTDPNGVIIQPVQWVAGPA